ncbi:MAG: SCO family protein [Bacteroidales bacterium]|nr:SCO family protein [Bacteroidales bacterium]
MKYLIVLTITALLLAGCNHKKEDVKSCCSKEANQKSTSDLKESLPGTSVYQLEYIWEVHDGKKLLMRQLAGKPVVLTMIFTHCEYACPMMVNDLKKIEANFSEEDRKLFTFVLVSFDHLRDTPERLKEYASSQGLGENWILLHGDADQVKELSVVLNISYEMQENGSFSHSNRKLVLDSQGTIVYSQEGLQTKSEPVVVALKRLLKG